MAISGNYATPVQVNGYACKNCTDVDYAKKHIDPAHPKDGPYGIDAKSDSKSKDSPAVTFGGQLAALAANGAITGSTASSGSANSGDQAGTSSGRLDISV